MYLCPLDEVGFCTRSVGQERPFSFKDLLDSDPALHTYRDALCIPKLHTKLYEVFNWASTFYSPSVFKVVETIPLYTRLLVGRGKNMEKKEKLILNTC